MVSEEAEDVVKRIDRGDVSVQILEDGCFEDDDWAAVLRAVAASRTLLALSLCIEMEDEDAEVIVKSLKDNKVLCRIEFLHGGFSYCDSPGNDTLRVLRYEGNDFSETSSSLANAIKNYTALLELDVSECMIGDDGAIAIGEALKHNKTLLELHLDDNEVGNAGLEAIAQGLRMNDTLQDLHLSRNDIKHIDPMADTLRHNKSLVGLWLGHNKIDTQGLNAILRALPYNNSLQSLLLGGCSFHYEEGKEQQADMEPLVRNTSLQNFGVNFAFQKWTDPITKRNRRIFEQKPIILQGMAPSLWPHLIAKQWPVQAIFEIFSEKPDALLHH